MVLSIGDGANYAPSGGGEPVVGPGEFCFAAAYLDHGHIYGQCQGLLAAGGTLTHVYDPDQQKVDAFLAKFPTTAKVDSFNALLEDPSLHLIASAAVPNLRSTIGQQVMQAGKDYFTDKSPFTSLAQLQEATAVQQSTGRRYFVYYAERIHNEAAWHAGELVAAGAIGDVIQVLNLAPHRLAEATRPAWFFNKLEYGGIITDIGSHQVEQFLTYAGCEDAEVNFAEVRNQAHPHRPELEDFGEISLSGVSSSGDPSAGSQQGPSFYSRIDWFTPAGLPVWGDGRSFILGTKGSIEVRKYADLARTTPASVVLLADGSGVTEIDCLGNVGFPFFGRMILDVLNRTETAMTQSHIFKAAEISMRAQTFADQRRAKQEA